MKPVTALQMKEIDRFTIESIGIPALVLMENAGRGVFEETKKFCGRLAGRKILVLAGKGGNGGDALVAARYFFLAGAAVEIVLLADEIEFFGPTLTNFKIVKNLQIKVSRLKKLSSGKINKLLKKCDLVIDGIFGFGFRGETSGGLAGIISAVNLARQKNNLLKVIAIDLPSGLDATSGRAAKSTIVADLTVTLGRPKTGALKSAAREYLGILKVIDIGLIEKGIKKTTPEVPDYSDFREIASFLPRRTADTHKSQSGILLVIAGSKNMSGAAILAAAAGLRGGAGLVYLALPEPLQKSAAPQIPEIITRGLPATEPGTFAAKGVGDLVPLLKNVDALVIGPGLTTNSETQKFFINLLDIWVKNFPLIPLLVDADGLNIISQNKKWSAVFFNAVKKKKPNLIFTPHIVELSRLTALSPEVIKNNREKIAASFSRNSGAIIVLKGARTIMTEPGGKIFINSNGGPVLATAGSGDVLSGVIGSLLSQGLEPIKAVRAGVFLHGLAADLLLTECGLLSRGFKAGDIVENLPAAYNELLNA